MDTTNKGDKPKSLADRKHSVSDRMLTGVMARIQSTRVTFAVRVKRKQGETHTDVPGNELGGQRPFLFGTHL